MALSATSTACWNSGVLSAYASLDIHPPGRQSKPTIIRATKLLDGARFCLSQSLLRTLVNRDVVAPRRTDVELARTPDLLSWILDHLLPLRDPAGGARHREKHGEHGHRKAHRFQCYPRIEIDVRIKFLLDEIFIAERNFLKRYRDIQQRVILDAKFIQDLVACSLHNLGARVIVLVDAMAKPHEPERIILI